MHRRVFVEGSNEPFDEQVTTNVLRVRSAPLQQPHGEHEFVLVVMLLHGFRDAFQLPVEGSARFVRAFFRGPFPPSRQPAAERVQFGPGALLAFRRREQDRLVTGGRVAALPADSPGQFVREGGGGGRFHRRHAQDHVVGVGPEVDAVGEFFRPQHGFRCCGGSGIDVPRRVLLGGPGELAEESDQACGLAQSFGVGHSTYRHAVLRFSGSRTESWTRDDAFNRFRSGSPE